jgi:hypothetical protein
MKRTLIVGLLAAAAVISSISPALAVGPHDRKWTRGSFAEYIVVPNKQGQPRTRQVYSGYSAQLPPPAILYYGYPFAERTYGTGLQFGH